MRYVTYLGSMMIEAFVLILFFASQAFGQDVVPGEYLIKLKGHSSSSGTSRFLGKASLKMNLKASIGAMNIHHMAFKAGEASADALEELRSDPNVEFIEPNYILRKLDDNISSDKMSLDDIQAFSVSNTSSFVQNRSNVHVTEAWQIISPSASNDPIVAIIDTGVDYQHSVFTGSHAIWTNSQEIPNNGLDDDGNGFVDDVHGWNFRANTNDPMDDDDHGTHVAGIILGVGQDIFASPVATAKIRIMPLKFLGADGSGSTADAVKAIYYAVNNGAQVINNSWGGSNYSQSLHEAMAFAYDHHVIMTAAAGNSSKNNDTSAMYPANLDVPSQISIAASTDSDGLASFSNYGRSTVHVASPGVGILSTVPGNSFRYMSGTSMAAPFVAGIAALALREASHLSGYQVRQLMLDSSSGVGAFASKLITGARVDFLATLQNAKAQSNTSMSQPSYKVTSPDSARATASTDTASTPKAGCGLVSTAVLGRGASGGPGAGGSGGGMSGQDIGITLALMMLPLLVWQVLRLRQPENRRRHERFMMNSEIKLKVGDRELIGQMNTISVGGASFQADALLEKGGIVQLQISSPDGKEQMSVEGCIVWNEANQSYGVQFDQEKDFVRQWSSKLSKATG